MEQLKNIAKELKEYTIFLNISVLLFSLHGLQRMHPENPKKLTLDYNYQMYAVQKWGFGG